MLEDGEGVKNVSVVVGGSLGGYVSMEVLGSHPGLFDGAVIAMSGQNVGRGRGFKAKVGLAAMAFVMPLLAPETMLQKMAAEARKNGHISGETALEIMLRPGMFFHQSQAQVDALRASDPLSSLPNFKGPVLFVNGSKDHRDSENMWLSACGSAHNCELKVYEEADHFFSHDDRFVDRFIDDCMQLAQRSQGLSQARQALSDVAEY